ncbi:hypothetical protein [uncultured Anaerococcus sp.]|uniref:hypothetical protein n=1 Tax=uncultured Anaerococcus sp. TaxID=293428 RepID=UPI00280A5686|nr:hypothetical protein [uncultured Anaerococcus sp.]
MIGLSQIKRTLKWFEGYLKHTNEKYSIEKNEKEKSYTLYFQRIRVYGNRTNYKKIKIAKFYRDRKDIEIYSYNGEDFDLFVKGLSMLKYWIDSATPEERFKKEIRSMYKHKNHKTDYGEDLYLNIASFIATGEQYPCLTAIGDRFEWLQKNFTDDEIDFYKRLFHINLSEFEGIKEVTYAY